MKGTINVYATEEGGLWLLDVHAPVGPSDRRRIGYTQTEVGEDPEAVIRDFIEMSGFSATGPIQVDYLFDDGYEQIASYPARAYSESISSPWWLLTKLVQVGLIVTAILIIWAVLNAAESYW